MERVDEGQSLLQLAPEAVGGRDDLPLPLLNKPVRRLTAGELCHLLRCHIAPEVLVPRAIACIEDEPFLEAAEYPGDLLTALLECDIRFWTEHEAWWRAMIPVLETAAAQIQAHLETQEDGGYLPWHLGDEFMAALLHFHSIHGPSAE